MNQYPLNPVDFYEDFLSFLRGIEKYGDKPAITTYTSEKEAVTRSYRQLTEDVYALAAAMRRYPAWSKGKSREGRRPLSGRGGSATNARD